MYGISISGSERLMLGRDSEKPGGSWSLSGNAPWPNCAAAFAPDSEIDWRASSALRATSRKILS